MHLARLQLHSSVPTPLHTPPPPPFFFLLSLFRPSPCSTASIDPSATYFRELCVNGLPALAIDIGASDYDSVAAARLVPYDSSLKPCVPTT